MTNKFSILLSIMAIVSFIHCSCQKKVSSLQEQYYSAILDATTGDRGNRKSVCRNMSSKKDRLSLMNYPDASIGVSYR